MSTASLPISIPPFSISKSKSNRSVRRVRSLSNLGTATSSWPHIEQELTFFATPKPDSHCGRPRATAPSEGFNAKHVTIDVPDTNGQPASACMPEEQPRGTLSTDPAVQQKRREQERHMLSLFEQYSSVKSSGSRKYNYQEKYPEDQPGEELGPNARFFNVYLDEAEKYDDDMIRALSGTLDALLIFAALFSAVVTTFAVDTRHALGPDQALITSSLLFEQVLYLRANGNTSAIAAITHSPYTPESPTHSGSDVVVNGLFFASLSLSLATALLSVLAKQWLQSYTSVTSGSARDTALIRHLRFMGFEKWKVPQIVGFLPLILHSSLGIFVVGLILFLRALYPILSWIIIGITGPTFFLYLLSIILSAIDVQCPYRISVLYTPVKSFILSLQLPFKWLKRWYWIQIYSERRWPYHHIQQFAHIVSTACGWAIRLIVRKLPAPTFTTPTLKSSELLLVQNNWLCRPILLDGILWLHNASSNISVRQIAACSLAGNDVDGFSTSQMKNIQLSKLHFTALGAGTETWDIDRKSVLSHRAAAKLADLFQRHNLRPVNLLSEWFEAAKGGHTSELAFFFQVWKVPVDSADSEGRTALTLSALYRRNAAVKLLLEWGANPNFIHPDDPLAHTALRVVCRREMDGDSLELGRLLLRAGADVNLRGPREDDWTPLFTAAYHGNVGTAKWLIENGATVDMIGGPPRETALHAASYFDHVAVVKVLLEHSTNFNLKNGMGNTALQVSIAKGSSRVEALLLEHGARE